jgi:hypothetical protein
MCELFDLTMFRWLLHGSLNCFFEDDSHVCQVSFRSASNFEPPCNYSAHMHTSKVNELLEKRHMANIIVTIVSFNVFMYGF